MAITVIHKRFLLLDNIIFQNVALTYRQS